MDHQFIVSASPRHKELPLGITPLSPRGNGPRTG